MTFHKEQGLFITFEGGEGAGKSTLCRKVFEELKKRSRQVVLTREPGGTKFGEELRSFLLHAKEDIQICSKAELLLFLSARAQHVEELILPKIAQGAIVLCDRFSDSTIAYQGEGRGLGFEYVKKLCYDAIPLKPNCTFFIRLSIEEGLKRIQRRKGGQDRIENEQISFHERLQAGFERLSREDPKRMIVLDGSLAEEALFIECMKHIEKLI